jgi:hypothetical protein
MGIYDTFTIDYPLPINFYVPHKYRSFILATIDQDNFQSKDLHGYMDSYYIDNKGFLYIENHSAFEKDPIAVERQKQYYHGHLRIYNMVYLDEENLDQKFWLEYDLKFTDGILVSATMISPTEEDFHGLH